MTDLYDDDMKQTLASRTAIRKVRDQIEGSMDRFGQDVLDGRRRLGIPDPEDSKKFGNDLLKFQIGLRALAGAIQNPAYRVEETPEQLRRWLSNPIEGHPATDDELRMYIEMLEERERKAA